jgi:hypothetical protein
MTRMDVQRHLWKFVLGEAVPAELPLARDTQTNRPNEVAA